MMDSNIPDEQLAEIEAKLREDIVWQIENSDAGFNQDMGVYFINGKWRSLPAARPCGACAIGSYLLHRQPKPSSIVSWDDVATFAKDVGVSHTWAYNLYMDVTSNMCRRDVLGDDRDQDQTLPLAKRLIAWAAECTKRKNEDREGQDE